MLTVISHNDCTLHDMGQQHPESPERITNINHILTNSKISLQNLTANIATKEHLLLAHADEYVKYVYANAPSKEIFCIGADTIMNKHSLNAALLSVGSIIQAVDLTMNKTDQQVFCNIRPPGHHAESSKAMGFCIFNNVAIGTLYALQQYQLNRIAIVDFDVHHGNGTQGILQNNPHILFCSSYQYPFYPYKRTKEESNTLHIKLAEGTNSKEYRELVKVKWLDQLHKFKPEMLLFSAGFDAHQDDPLGGINLVTEDFFWLTKEIIQATRDYTNNKIISTLEGGYNLNVLGESVLAHLSALEY